MKETDILNQYEPYGLFLWVIFWTLAVINLYWSFLSIISLLVFFVLKSGFERHAEEIDGDPRIPFVSVMLFGIIGYIGYLGYCKLKTKPKKRR